MPLTLGQAGLGYNSSTAWDYFHINSIVKGDDGHYLLSARHASTIYKINGTDGSIIWRLGGKHSDFELGPNVTFGFQHHARSLATSSPDTDIISLFDNSVYGSESAGGGDKEVHVYPYSRGKYIRLDHTTKKASLHRAFLPPDRGAPILTKSQGSLQTLPGGNALINWGSEGQISEYTEGGDAIFHAFLDSGSLQDNLQNYRAFRYNWTGFSPETPAVFAEQGPHGVDVYVSWNGDTQTRTWRYVWDEDVGGASVTRSKDVRRTGFETVLRIGNEGEVMGRVHVQALDADGRSLVISEGVRPIAAYWVRARDVSGDGGTQQVLAMEL